MPRDAEISYLIGFVLGFGKRWEYSRDVSASVEVDLLLLSLRFFFSCGTRTMLVFGGKVVYF